MGVVYVFSLIFSFDNSCMMNYNRSGVFGNIPTTLAETLYPYAVRWNFVVAVRTAHLVSCEIC